MVASVEKRIGRDRLERVEGSRLGLDRKLVDRRIVVDRKRLVVRRLAVQVEQSHHLQ